MLDAVDKFLCINTTISQENIIVTRALNIILDAVDIISRMHTVIQCMISKCHYILCFNHFT